MSTPLPRIAMSCPIDCGFFERMMTGPADAVAVEVTNWSPLLATSISTTCPAAALDSADEAAEAGKDTAGDADDEAPPLEEDPQLVASTAIANAAAARFRVDVIGIRKGYPATATPTLSS
jgi:hypothetical protein